LVVTVIDSICGSGKSTVVRQRLYEEGPDHRALFVTPYLDEIETTIKQIPWFKQPEEIDGRKLNGLKQLLAAGECVCTTHALFIRMDDECRSLITAVGYELVMDEALSPTDELILNRKDYDAITDGEFPLISLDQETGIITWLGGENYGGGDSEPGQFSELKEDCDSGTISIVHRDDRTIHMIWTIKIENFSCFSSFTLMTYMFKASYLYGFLMKSGFTVFFDPQLDARDTEIKKDLCQLISVYSGRYNLDAFSARTALSLSWFRNKKNVGAIYELSASLRGFLEYYMKVKKGEYIWTTFLSAKAAVGNRRYGEGFLSCNMRATNDYRDRTVVVYAANRFFNPNTRKLFDEISVSDDEFALSEIVQFIFRSAVRENKRITVYIPSKRMRDLFVSWLES